MQYNSFLIYYGKIDSFYILLSQRESFVFCTVVLNLPEFWEIF